MADLTLSGAYFSAYDNTGTGIAASKLGANTNIAHEGTGIGSRTLIVKVAKSNLTTAELNTIVKAIKQGGLNTKNATNGDDAFTVVGVSSDNGDTGGTTNFVSGESDVVYLALQGTGVFTPDDANAYGVSGAVTTLETVFADYAVPTTGAAL